MASSKGNRKVVVKPFIKGKPTDEYTVRKSLKFFGILLLTAFMTFLVCSLTSFREDILRIGISIVIEVLVLLIFFDRGASLGMDAVARGEILYQHIEKGTEVSDSEKKIPFHFMKGYAIGILGSLLFFILALILAFTAERQMTGAGVLPSWMDTYLRRTEISGALAQYSQSASVSFTDLIRIVVRILIMPFISMAGAENRDLLLTMERISPILVLLPALSYGTGYLTGPSRRTLIHSEIAENRRRRISREKKEKRARISATPKGPEQLN